MLFRVLLFTFTVLRLTGADDPWIKVLELKSGCDLRIVKRESKQPVLATLDEATPDSLVIVLKDRQQSIPKDDIERIDARPATQGSRLVRENRTTTTMPGKTEPAVGPARSSGRPGTSTSTSLTVAPRPEFQTVYRRTASPPVR